LVFTNQHDLPVKIWQSVVGGNIAQSGKAFRLYLRWISSTTSGALTAGRRTSESGLQIRSFQNVSHE